MNLPQTVINFVCLFGKSYMYYTRPMAQMFVKVYEGKSKTAMP